MSLKTSSFYDFGDFRIDVAEKILLRDGESVPVTPKVFDTLLVFAENPGRLVSKDELMEKLWNESFVEESNLSFNIMMLRKALGDSASNPKYIETIPKRGYRFIAEVQNGRHHKAQLVLLDKSRREDSTASPRAESGGEAPLPAAHSGAHPAAAAVVALDEWKRERTDPNVETAEAEPYVVRPKLSLAASPVRHRGISNRFVIVGTAAVVLAAFSLYYLLNRDISSNATSMPTLARLTSNGKTKIAAISPNGEFISYVLDEEGRNSLWLKNVATGSDTQILPPAEGVSLTHPKFSPDGNYIYYIANKTLNQLPLLGGLPKKIIADVGVRAGYSEISFSPEGNQFAFVRHLSDGQSDVVVAAADGSNEKSIASSTRPEIFLRSAAWSPDGDVIAVVRQEADGPNSVAAVRIVDGSVSAIPSPAWPLISQIAWRPIGNGLVAIATEGRSSITHQIWSLSYPDGNAKNITNDLNNYQSVSLSADGREIVAVRIEQASHIWIVTGDDTSRGRQLSHGIDRYDGIQGLSVSTDGKITYESTPGGKGEIWRMDSEGRGIEQLVNESGASTASPDGKYVVFQSRDADGVGLFRYEPGSGERRRLTNGTDIWSSFSSDGNSVVFTRWAEQVAIWKVSIEGGEAVKLTNVPGYATCPAVSPDGKFVAFHWSGSGPKSGPEIAVVSIDGGEIVKTFQLPTQYLVGYAKNALQWTPDGQAINYALFRGDFSNIWRQPIDGSPAYQVTNFTEDRIFNFAYSPDGSKLALARGTFNRDAVLIKAP